MTCPICHGSSYCHPLQGGKVDYGVAIFCSCHPKAGEVVSARVTSPDLDSDLKVETYADPGHNLRAAREAEELLRQYREPEPEAEPSPQEAAFATRKELKPIRAELRDAVNKINEHIDTTMKGGRSAF